MSTATAVLCDRIACRFPTSLGESYTAIKNVSLVVDEGRFVTLVGPTGCGKSTLLNAVAGLLSPSEGTIEIFGQPLKGLNRDAAYLFQQDGLLPWKTALENVALGLLFLGLQRREALTEAAHWLHTVGLAGFEDRYPHQLSGGMRKRVAIAQCWAVNPRILLMDEPFSALDVQTRQLMETELLSLWAGSEKTVLFVTHDLDEAIALADEVLVLSAGPAARVIGSYTVDLPRPRNVAEIRLEPRFVEIYRDIWEQLRGEVVRAHGRERGA
ncbi:ABC transporter ATP-binding protein [Limnochorda pilosa]|uniref:Mannosyltransferase n=1 Tax=Limnochorda pilosa TaxID=1555112 RepID=A0A0K2SGN7_LIMPI|nr:ABC transporter ATP-binding protein [Limnochorda pilosa]BAS26187.1 mannosyltransferase [Limnochorda pilosa]